MSQVTSDRIKGWDDIHLFYQTHADAYQHDKLTHAMAALKQVNGTNLKKANDGCLKMLLQQSITTREWMVKGIYESRAKDYSNPFRQMVYETTGEMNAVVGKLEDNSFIKKEITELKAYKNSITHKLKKLNLA